MKRRLIGFASVLGVSLLASATFSGCAILGPVADEMNPYGQGAFGGDNGGSRDNGTILNASGGGAGEAERARHQLDVSMSTYRKAALPEPAYPVIRPAEVRLMWIPDHLNKHNDLVPAHYYYLRVLPDIWQTQDAFEYDQQLQNQPGINYAAPAGATAAAAPGAPAPAAGSGAATNYGTGQSGTSTPWVYKESK